MKIKPIQAFAAGAVLFAVLAGSVQAVPTSIEGTVSFSGSATTDDANLANATKFTDFGTVTVGQESGLSGDYAGTAGAPVDFTPFTWDPVTASVPLNPLWTFDNGGNTYSFDLTSLSVDFVSSTALVLSGLGTAMITGPGMDKLPTSGLWNLSGQTQGGAASFTFSSSSTVPTPAVPDGGATALLFGLSMLGFGLLKSRITA